MMMQAAIGETPQKIKSPAVDKLNGAMKKPQTNYTNKSAYKPRPVFQDVRMAAYGRWEYIHSALGIKIISADYRKHTSCPGCGGKDRFHVKVDYANTGAWFCRGGGDYQAGDGFNLICHVFGWSLAESCKAVADILGLSEMDNDSYQQLRAQAEKQAAKMAEEAEKKHEQARRDRDMLTMLEDLEDAIKHRQYLQRTLIKTAGSYIATPTEDEVQAVKELVTTCIDGYADYMRGDDNG